MKARVDELEHEFRKLQFEFRESSRPLSNTVGYQLSAAELLEQSGRKPINGSVKST